MSLEVTMQNSYQVQTCEIFFYWEHWMKVFTSHNGYQQIWQKVIWAGSRSLKGKVQNIAWFISFENIGNIGNIGSFYFTQKLPSTWGCFILLSHDNLGKFKVIGRKILNFLSDLYRFIDKYWKFRLNIKIAYDLDVFHEPRVNWRSSRSWLNKALFLSMPFLVQSSHAYL